MHYNTNRTQSMFISPSRALGVVTVIVFCLAMYLVSTRMTVPQVHASANVPPGTISSSPASGPVGTTITVSGSGWSQPDGTPVYFGYLVNSACSLVSDSQNGSLSGGAFGGWMRWPLGTPANVYTVCAIISGDSQTHDAGSFTVLSTSAPAVSITPASLQENQQATITATNFVPPGSSINFFWTLTNGSIVQSLGSAISNSVGTALLTFTVPIMPLNSGSYLIQSQSGAGQPPPYSASTTFAYTAPTVPPSPTPSPKASPTPSPTATQAPTPTPVASVIATATAVSSPAAGATPTTVPTHTGGVTPTAVPNKGSTTPTTSSTQTGGGGGSGTSNDQSNTPLLVVGVVSALVMLIAVLALVLWRRRSRKLARMQPPPPVAPAGPGLYPGQYAAPAQGPFVMPGMSQSFQQSGQPGAPMPAQAGQYQPVAAPAPVPPWGRNAQSGQIGPAGPAPLQAPMAYRSLLAPTTPPPNGPAQQYSDGIGTMPPSADPALDAMRRQAQAGLFVAPLPPRGGS